MTFAEFIDRFYETLDAEGFDEERDYCEGCPCRETCRRDETFWGCGVWEMYMGEDL